MTNIDASMHLLGFTESMASIQLAQMCKYVTVGSMKMQVCIFLVTLEGKYDKYLVSRLR